MVHSTDFLPSGSVGVFPIAFVFFTAFVGFLAPRHVDEAGGLEGVSIFSVVVVELGLGCSTGVLDLLVIVDCSF